MKKVCGLAISVLMIMLVLASGCIGGTNEAGEKISGEATDVLEAEQTQIKTNCDDENICTKDIFNELTNTCEYETIKNCCGNGICESNERCNEETYQTNCLEDCSRTCPAHIIVHKDEEINTDDVFVFTCADDNCRQINEYTFRITGTSKLKVYLTNIGEQTSSKIYSDFVCGIGGEQAVVDGESIKGVVFSDYFDTNKEELTVNAVQSVGNKANYYFAFDTTNLEESYIADCKLYIKSNELNFNQRISLMFA